MRSGPEWFILLEAIGLLSFAMNAMIVTRSKGLSTLTREALNDIAETTLGNATDFAAGAPDPARTVKLD